MSGGASVDIATVPLVASNSACTGTLIAPDRVLAAAHCVAQFPTRGPAEQPVPAPVGTPGRPSAAVTGQFEDGAGDGLLRMSDLGWFFDRPVENDGDDSTTGSALRTRRRRVSVL